MSIEFVTGNLFDSDCEAWVNTVNVVGVMGRGIALEYKQRFPEMFKAYKQACSKGEVQTGKMFVWQTHSDKPKWIINFPTKKHWRNPSEYNYIISGLIDLQQVLANNNISSIAIPALGCSNGGLVWSKVKDLLSAFSCIVPNKRIVVYNP